MVNSVIINAKIPAELKEAVRQVAFEERLSSSALLVRCLRENPRVAERFQKLLTEAEKKSARKPAV